MRDWDDGNAYQQEDNDGGTPQNAELPAEPNLASTPAEPQYHDPYLVPAHTDQVQPNEEFVQQSYIDVLGHEPDAAAVAPAPELHPHEQQLDLFQMQGAALPDHTEVASPPVAYAPEPVAAPVAHEPFINQWGNPVVDMNAYQQQISQVDTSDYHKLANTYDTLINQQVALNQNSFETYQQYESLVKEKGADSADAQSLKSHMDQVAAASNALAASVQEVEANILSASQEKETEAANLYQQYQTVVQEHGANSQEAQAMYTTYQVARDTASAGVVMELVQKYNEMHLYDNGGPPDDRRQGQSTGSGIMEDLMIGMGMATLSSNTFQQESTEYQAPRSVGHYADPLPGQNEARDAQSQFQNQNYINDLISQYTGQPAENVNPQPEAHTQAPTVEVAPHQEVPANHQEVPANHQNEYVDNRGQSDGGNGGWAGVAGGEFYDGMDSSGGDSWFGAGSDYMNNSNDYTAGGNFSTTQYQDSGNEGQGPISQPTQLAPSAANQAPSVDIFFAQQEDLYSQLEQVHDDYYKAVETHGENSEQAIQAANAFENLSSQYSAITQARNESENQMGFPSGKEDAAMSQAINAALNPHLVNMMGTDEMGGHKNFDGSYTIDGVDYVSKEAAFPTTVDNTVRTDIQVFGTTAYRGMTGSDGDIKIILDKQFSNPDVQQVEINGTIYNRPQDHSSNWVPEALQPAVDAVVDVVSELPGGNLAINSVKAIPGIANAAGDAVGTALKYAEGHSYGDAVNDALNAITPSGHGRDIGSMGNPMGDFDPGASTDDSGAIPATVPYADGIKNAAGFIVDAGAKAVDTFVVHPIVEGANAIDRLSSEVLSPEDAAKEFGKAAIGVATALPLVGGAVRAVDAGAEFVNGMRAADAAAEAAGAARAGSHIGQIENVAVDGIYGADGQLIKAGNYVDVPGGSVPRLEVNHVDVPARGPVAHIEIPGGEVPRLELFPEAEVMHPVESPVGHATTPHEVIAEPAAPIEMPSVGHPASNQALDSVQRSIESAPNLSERFDRVMNNLRESGVEVTGLSSREMRDLTGSGQTAAVFYMDEGVPQIAMLNNLSPGAKYEAVLHELSHRTDYLNPLKNTGTGAVEFSSDAGNLLVPNYREFASVSEFKSHAVEFAAQKQVASAYIAEGNLVDAGAVTNRMRETVDARLGVQAELKDSVPKVEAALAEHRPIEITDGEAGSQRYVVTIADAKGLPKEVSFPGPAGLDQSQAATHIQTALEQLKGDIPINDAALAKSIDELNAFKEIVASGGTRTVREMEQPSVVPHSRRGKNFSEE